MLRKQTWCHFLASLALASSASAQIEVAWWNAHDLPESFDGDSVTYAVVVKSNGGVIAAARSNFPEHARFLRFGPAGAFAGSVLAPVPHIFSKGLLAPADEAYFAGVPRVSGPGFRLVKLSSGGAVLWDRAIPAATSLGQPVEALLDANGGVALIGVDQAAGGRTLVRGFTPAGVATYSYDVQLGPASEALGEAVLDGNGDIILVGSADTRATVAALDTSSGQIEWQVFDSGALGLGARYVALARGANGVLAVAGASTLAGSIDVRVRTLDATGAVLWSAAVDAGANGVETVTDIAYASDGALWVTGRSSASGATSSFFLRFPRGSSVPARFFWGAPQTKQLFAAGPGQMWALAEIAAPFSAPEVGAFQVDFNGSISVPVGAVVDLGGSEKLLFCAARGPGQTFVVGGRSGETPGGLGFFDPISMVAKFDFSDAPREYCQAQVNSAGCVPVLSCSGRAKLTSFQPFMIRFGDVISAAAGLYFYGATGASSTPFLGGLKCVASPVSRSPLIIAGSSGPAPCQGELAIDWNAFARGQLGGAPAPELSVPGTAIYLQCWSRDGASAFGTNLSSALRYVVLP